MNKLFSLLMIIIGVSFGLLGDTMLKKAHSLFDLYTFIGALLFGLAAFPAYIAFTTMDFGAVGIIWSVISNIIFISLSVMIYHEGITISRIIALLLSFVAAFLA